MKVKRVELFGLLQALGTLGNLSGVKFAYALIKNKKKIQAELDTLKETVKPSNKLQEYENKRVELCKQYCEKDKEGKPVIKNNSYSGLDVNVKFDAEIKKLKEEYKTELDNREKQVKEYNKLLQEKVEIELHKIAVDDLPKDITSKQLESLWLIIDGTK